MTCYNNPQIMNQNKLTLCNNTEKSNICDKKLHLHNKWPFFALFFFFHFCLGETIEKKDYSILIFHTPQARREWNNGKCLLMEKKNCRFNTFVNVFCREKRCQWKPRKILKRLFDEAFKDTTIVTHLNWHRTPLCLRDGHEYINVNRISQLISSQCEMLTLQPRWFKVVQIILARSGCRVISSIHANNFGS